MAWEGEGGLTAEPSWCSSSSQVPSTVLKCLMINTRVVNKLFHILASFQDVIAHESRAALAISYGNLLTNSCSNSSAKAVQNGMLCPVHQHPFASSTMRFTIASPRGFRQQWTHPCGCSPAMTSGWMTVFQLRVLKTRSSAKKKQRASTNENRVAPASTRMSRS